MAQDTGAVPPIWETWIEFWATGFSLGPTQDVTGIWGELISRWEFSLYLCLSQT